jgi:site-specific DNA-methyltransferase (adenine-specific)
MKASLQKVRAQRNRTITLSEDEFRAFEKELLTLSGPVMFRDIENRVINQDLLGILDFLPSSFADLIFVDPPYNLTKSFNGTVFRERPIQSYEEWIECWLSKLIRTLKPDGSVYICSDWRSSAAVHLAAERYLMVRNRITWEREKGRGASANWKNCSEDIWFCTKSEKYVFNLDQVKMKRQVIAPYTDPAGNPKDWEKSEDGNYRLTHPSNIWTDLTVPFWSMPENTDHPTQKPEKLLGKIILASSQVGGVVFDPFSGSGTSCVVAKKLGRRYVGVEIDRMFSVLSEKRLAMADCDGSIQGYADGVFWERNSAQNVRWTGNRRHAPDTLPLPLVGPNQKNSGS